LDTVARRIIPLPFRRPPLRRIRRFRAKPDKKIVDGQAASPSSWKTPFIAIAHGRGQRQEHLLCPLVERAVHRRIHRIREVQTVGGLDCAVERGSSALEPSGKLRGSDRAGGLGVRRNGLRAGRRGLARDPSSPEMLRPATICRRDSARTWAASRFMRGAFAPDLSLRPQGSRPVPASEQQRRRYRPLCCAVRVAPGDRTTFCLTLAAVGTWRKTPRWRGGDHDAYEQRRRRGLPIDVAHTAASTTFRRLCGDPSYLGSIPFGEKRPSLTLGLEITQTPMW
jgi:hypothetical protein